MNWTTFYESCTDKELLHYWHDLHKLRMHMKQVLTVRDRMSKQMSAIERMLDKRQNSK